MNLLSMRYRVIIALITFMNAPICFSQKNETAMLLKKMDEILYDDPSQAIKIGENLLHNPENGSVKPETALLLAKSYLVTGHYTQALTYAEMAANEAKSTENKNNIFDASLLAAEIYAYLDLFEISEEYLNEAEKIAGNNQGFQKRLDAFRVFVLASGSKIQNVKPTPDEIRVNSFITKGTPLQLAAIKDLQPDSAKVHFEKNLDILQKSGAYWQMLALTDYGNYCFAKKDYQTAMQLFEQAMKKGRSIGNPYFMSRINEKLSVIASVSGNKPRFRELRQKAKAAENDYDTQITLATNLAFDLLQKKKEEKISQAENFRQNITAGMGIFALFILVCWLVVKWQFALRTAHIQDIISYLKLIKNIGEKQETAIKSTVKTLSIPRETENILLAKMEKFEAGKKYLNKDISLAQMATMLDTNTKYLSEVINKYKRKNFNAYINSLRIRHIVEKLKSDPKYMNYKVSYLAEECGFSSHSMFSSAFKNVTGITPNMFLQFLSDDRLIEKQQLVEP